MKKFQVIWAKKAEYDLELIIEHIKLDSLDIAKNIFFGIKEKCAELYIFPESRRVVPELQQIGVLRYRELIYKRWRVIYKVDDEKVYILIVVDSSRNIEDILFQRLLQDDNKK